MLLTGNRLARRFSIGGNAGYIVKVDVSEDANYTLDAEVWYETTRVDDGYHIRLENGAALLFHDRELIKYARSGRLSEVLDALTRHYVLTAARPYPVLGGAGTDAHSQRGF